MFEHGATVRRTAADPDTRKATMAGGPSVDDGSVGRAVNTLAGAVDVAIGVNVDELTSSQIRRLLDANEIAVKRLTARRAQLAHTLVTRAAERARVERPDDVRAPERARRDARRKIAQDHNLTPSQAKQADETGRRLAERPRVADAAGRGHLSDDHLRLLNRTLDQLTLVGSDVRDSVEAELLEAAPTLDAVAFGRLCRRRLSEIDLEASQRDLDRRHARRSGRIADTPNGMTHLGVDVTGVDAEWLHTAVNAFRRPDAQGEHRSPEARTADAVVDMARAALTTLDDPDARGARPIFHFVINGTSLGELEDWKVGEALHTGPLPRTELEGLLGDSHLAAILGDAKRLPVAVTEQVRTVPAALWRLLVVRDGGCIWDGCDAPAAWCDVMHLGTAYANDGKLSPATAGLGCRRHHRKVDRGHADVSWHDRRPVARGRSTIRPPNKPPKVAGPDRDRGQDQPHNPAPEVARQLPLA